MLRFLHNADWQGFGKPVCPASAMLTSAPVSGRERLTAITRAWSGWARQQGAALLFGGWGILFDSPSPPARPCRRPAVPLEALKLPVSGDPGNHEHGGAGSLCKEALFQGGASPAGSQPARFCWTRQPLCIGHDLGWQVLRSAAPVRCWRKAEPLDPTAWLRHLDFFAWVDQATHRIRMVRSRALGHSRAPTPTTRTHRCHQPQSICPPFPPPRSTTSPRRLAWAQAGGAAAWYQALSRDGRFPASADLLLRFRCLVGERLPVAPP